MQPNSDKFMKVCSMLGWLWEGQYFEEHVTEVVSGADLSLLASEICKPLSPLSLHTDTG